MLRIVVVITGMILAWAAMLSGHAFAADKRVALVIGNAAYQHALPLANPVKDAKLIGKTLRDAGFEVIEGTDLDKFGMQRAIDRFTEASFEADVGLVYYSGHGIQVDGRNYLIPIDAELTSAAHLRTRTIQAETILAALPPDPSVGILILDACRDNPLSRSLMASLPATRSTAVGTGLAAVQAVNFGTGTGGTLIAYATDPGSVALDGQGDNSPYTMALARNLAVPGVELQSALTRVRGEVTEATLGKQRPWHNASLGREVFLGGPKPEPVPEAAPAPAPAAPAASAEPAISPLEQLMWEEASKRNTPAHYEAYLAKFPNGGFATLARINMDQLKQAEAQKVAALAEEASRAATVEAANEPAIGADADADAGTELTEATLRLDRDGRVEVQERLLVLGYDIASVDGRFGSGTRGAIDAWQKESGFAETGFLTRKQLARLKIDSEALHQAYRQQQQDAARQAVRKQQAVDRQTAEDRQKAAARNAEKERAAARQQERQKAAKKQREQATASAKKPDRSQADKQAAAKPGKKVPTKRVCRDPIYPSTTVHVVPYDGFCPFGLKTIQVY